jgi:hypothetical protein
MKVLALNSSPRSGGDSYTAMMLYPVDRADHSPLGCSGSAFRRVKRREHEHD